MVETINIKVDLDRASQFKLIKNVLFHELMNGPVSLDDLTTKILYAQYECRINEPIFNMKRTKLSEL